MKINKKAQYGILFAVYVANAGRATIETAALNLKLSASFLEQVARLLRLGGILKSIKGRSGGYELEGSPTIGQVLSALSSASLLNKGDYDRLRVGGVEQRAFGHFIKNLTKGMEPYLSLQVKDLTHKMAWTELRSLDQIPEVGAN